MSRYNQTVQLWQSWNVRTASDLAKFLDSFRILFAYNSGKIENQEITYNDTREIFENGQVTGFTGNPRTLFEQQNQKLCYELLKEKFALREPLSVELVKELHAVLTGGTYDERRYISNGERPGAFKKHDYVTGIHEVGSSPEAVEDDLRKLLEEVNEAGEAAALKVGTYLHAGFAYIHPFADGNGRVGRTLLNYWLLLCNHPPLIVYDEDKRRYYDALRLYDEAEEIIPLEDFFKEQVTKTWNRALELSEGQTRERRGLTTFL